MSASSFSPGSLTKVYGVLCDELKYMIHYQEGYLYILDLKHVVIGSDARGVVCVEPRIIFTNNPKYYTCHISNRSNIKCMFSYDEMMLIIKRNYDYAFRHNGIINNSGISKADEMLDSFRLYIAMSCNAEIPGLDIKCGRPIVGFDLKQEYLYMFVDNSGDSHHMYAINFETIKIIWMCINEVKYAEDSNGKRND